MKVHSPPSGFLLPLVCVDGAEKKNISIYAGENIICEFYFIVISHLNLFSSFKFSRVYFIIFPWN